MLNNVFSAPVMAACPQLPHELAREPREGQLSRRQPSRAIQILAISENPTLSVYLSGLFRKSGWSVARARTCAEVVPFLTGNRAAVAVCEESLSDGFWHDVAAELRGLPDAPALVVIGDDQSLVHDVPTFGGFEALVRPLLDSDVIWTIASAWYAWMKRFERNHTGAQ